jgi:DNA-binding NarL/FixJ family response regulator
MTRILIVANSAIARAGLATLLTANSTFIVVGSIASKEFSLEQSTALQPDVVLLELDQQDEDLLSVLPFGEDDLEIPDLILLVDNLQQAWVGEILRVGVRGILPSDAIASEIIAAVDAVAAGLVVVHPDLITSLTLPAPSNRSLPTPTPGLTPREIEVLGMLAEGLANKAIARRLSISEHTVKFHISSIFSKLNVSSRTEAVTLGARQGLILL